MKQLTYNPTNALSIMLAVLFLNKYPQAEVKTSKSKGTDFLSKLSEEEGYKPSYAVTLLQEESELSSELAAGIVALHSDVESFENRMVLRKINENNKTEIERLTTAGRAVNAYKASAAFVKDADDYNDTRLFEEEVVEGPVTDTTKPEADTSESDDVKQ